jgi:hypothetical protein
LGDRLAKELPQIILGERKMSISRMLVTAGCAVAMLAGAPAAFAQRGGGGHGGGGGFHGGGSMGGFRGGTMGTFGRGPGPAVGTRGVGPVGRPGSMMGQGGFNNFNRGGFNRGFNNGFNRGGFNNGFNRGNFHNGGAFVRGGNFNRGAFVHGGFANGRFVNGRFVNGRFFGPTHFFHPFFNFRPFASVGFGLWAGWPFAYPYSYYYPYYYGGYGGYPYYYPYTSEPINWDDYVSSDYNSSSVDTSAAAAQPDQSNLGGVTFVVNPGTAEVYVDGSLIGTAGQFGETAQPLGLTPGRHHIEIRAPGYHTVSFDADINAGQVIPYQGTLEKE